MNVLLHASRCESRPGSRNQVILLTCPGRLYQVGPARSMPTRASVSVEAETSLFSERVTRVLDRLIGKAGSRRACAGQLPELTSRRMLGSAKDWRVGLVDIQPGRPMQNGHVESFHGRLRDECLNASWFRTMSDVRSSLASWRQEYNCQQPHSSFEYRTPEEFRLKADYSDAENRERFPHEPAGLNATESRCTAIKIILIGRLMPSIKLPVAALRSQR
jgi:putative transposase